MRILLGMVVFLSSCVMSSAQDYYADIHNSVVQGRYRVVFSSFPPQAGHPVGHAFVTWQTETPSGIITNGVFGFYPSISNAFMVVWENGTVRPELQSTIALADKSVSFRVDQAQFTNSLAVMRAWQAAPPVYSLDGNNCVDFLVNVGSAIGIVMPDHGPVGHLLPDTYMQHLMDELEAGNLETKDRNTITVAIGGDYSVGQLRYPVDGSDPVFTGRERTTSSGIITEANYDRGKLWGPSCVWYPDGHTWYHDNSVNPEVSMMLYPNHNLLIGYDPNKSVQNGTITNVQGNVYEGPSVDGLEDGQGKMTMFNGTVYEGTWVKGDIAGQGKTTFTNVQTLTGQFLGGNLISGRVTYPDGKYLEGQRDANGNFGAGSFLHNPDGGIYQGEPGNGGAGNGNEGAGGGGGRGGMGNGGGGVWAGPSGNSGHVIGIERDYNVGKETVTIDHGDHIEKIEHSFPAVDTCPGDGGDHD